MTSPLDATHFKSLTRDYYLSDEMFRKEQKLVMGRQWHYIAHVSEIPNPGDYVVDDYAGESIVVARNNDGSVNCFLNVCRHRGFPVCQHKSGQTSRFVCAYHRWTYDLAGRLIGAPDMPNGKAIDYKDWGLHHVQSEIWNGLVFICLSEENQPSIGAHIDALSPELKRAQPLHWKKAYEQRYLIDANWKVLLENFLECYHCRGTHPELMAAMDLDGMYDNVSQRPIGPYSGGWVPLKSGMKTQSLDGELRSMPLGEFSGSEEVPTCWGAGFQIAPLLTRIIAHVDHAMIFSIRPIDAAHVEWVSRWFVHGEAQEGRDYDLDELTKVWKATNDQDISLCVGAFRGISSKRYVPGPLSVAREPAIHTAVMTYLELMGQPRARA